MIVVDTSALMAIVLDEALAEACSAVLESAGAHFDVGRYLAEALIVAGRRGVAREVETLVRGLGIEVVPATGASARRVANAYSR